MLNKKKLTQNINALFFSMPLFLHLQKIKNGVKNEMKVKEYKH